MTKAEELETLRRKLGASLDMSGNARPGLAGRVKAIRARIAELEAE